MKLRITGASNFVNRMFEACGNYQWAREFLKNSLEAGATRIEFGIEWQAVDKCGVYRRTVADDGYGMNADELRRFFSTLGEGAKKIGGVHDNFGVGAKIAALPWNSEGVVVISCKGGKAAMIWIVLDPDSGDYELREFETEEGRTCVIDPSQIDWGPEEVDWGAVRPDWISDHGTIVVLLGGEEYPDTVLGNPQAGERDIKGLSVYLNTRFWDLTKVDLTVVELRSERKSQWPQGPDERDDTRRPNNRRIMGARHYLTGVPAQAGKLAFQGVFDLDEKRVAAEWYLWEGERPAIHSYAKKPGYIAVRYGDELFELTSNKVHFRWFGVIESKVQQNLTIILEPQFYVQTNGRWGVHPDQSRNRLIFTGNGEKGIALPLSDWGAEFADNLPEPILEAIRAARGDLSGAIEDEEYRKRLQDRFGKRWMAKAIVLATKSDQDDRQPITGRPEEVQIFPPLEHSEDRRRRNRQKTLAVLHKKGTLGGPDDGVERETPVDVPRYRLAGKEIFEKPWHLAAWSPRDPQGPTVYVNIDSPILEDVVKYNQDQYADVFAEEVERIVHQSFGEVAACKIAHSQKLTRELSEQELDDEYRNEAALTVGLMGLLAEESLINQRLAKLGRRKSAA